MQNGLLSFLALKMTTKLSEESAQAKNRIGISPVSRRQKRRAESSGPKQRDKAPRVSMIHGKKSQQRSPCGSTRKQGRAKTKAASNGVGMREAPGAASMSGRMPPRKKMHGAGLPRQAGRSAVAGRAAAANGREASPAHGSIGEGLATMSLPMRGEISKGDFSIFLVSVIMLFR